MTTRMVVPNFTEFFKSQSGAPLEFVCRYGANFFHDLIFLSSLLHDAQFYPKEISLVRKVLTIPLERDRWETWDGNDLDGIASRLTMRPVRSLRWEMKGKRVSLATAAKRGRFDLRHTFPAEQAWQDMDRAQIVLASHGPLKLRVDFDDSPEIRLTDQP